MSRLLLLFALTVIITAQSVTEKHMRVRIIATVGTYARYYGQECDAKVFDPGIQPQINMTQLLPRGSGWQAVDPTILHMVREGWGNMP